VSYHSTVNLTRDSDWSLDYEIQLAYWQVDIINAKLANRKVCIEEKLIDKSSGEFKMTPQEELFAKFFNQQTVAVKDMDVLTLRAHREELSLIVLEARAKLSATQNALDEIERKSRGVPGFQRSVNTDEATSEAINAINNRAKRLDKKEKIRQSLLAMGVLPKDVEQMMSARNIRETVTRPLSNPAASTAETKSTETKPKPKQQDGIDWDTIINEAKAMQPKESKPFVNPFAPKTEPIMENINGTDSSNNCRDNGSGSVSSSILHIENNTIDGNTGESIQVIEEVKPEPKPSFNPFAK